MLMGEVAYEKSKNEYEYNMDYTCGQYAMYFFVVSLGELYHDRHDEAVRDREFAHFFEGGDQCHRGVHISSGRYADCI